MTVLTIIITVLCSEKPKSMALRLLNRIVAVLAVVLASAILIANWVFSKKEKGYLGKLWIMFCVAMIFLVLASLFMFLLDKGEKQGGEQYPGIVQGDERDEKYPEKYLDDDDGSIDFENVGSGRSRRRCRFW